MIRSICRDQFILMQKAVPAKSDDISIARDLLETLIANQDRCVGMAANMIGFNKAIIAFWNGIGYTVMLNPQITFKSHSYETEEGCLSLEGVRKTVRYKQIKVSYESMDFSKHSDVFSDYTAQIIQHEIDHLNGRLI